MKTRSAVCLLAALALPAFGLPRFLVDPDHESVWGHGWPAGATVTVSANGTQVGTAPVNEWGDWHLFGGHGGHAYDLAAGDTVTADDGTTQIAHQVTSLAVTGVDPAADRVEGTAEPGSWVEVVVHDPYRARWVQADGQGAWLADFSVAAGPDPPEGPADLVPGIRGYAVQSDDRSAPYGATWIEWWVDLPHFQVDSRDNRLSGSEWPVGAMVTVSVGGQEIGTAWVNDWGDWQLSFDEHGRNLAAGDTVTVDDGTTQIAHQVTSLAITGVDPAADRVEGTAEPGSWVEVFVHDPSGSRWVQADGQGAWLADFSVASGPDPWEGPRDIEPGTTGAAAQYDDRSVPYGSTWIEWRVDRPWFDVNPMSRTVWGHEWPPNETVLLVVGDPAAPLYAGQGTVNNWGRWWMEDLPVELPPGTPLRAMCGPVEKTHEVRALRVLFVDGAADTVEGTAGADSEVHVVFWTASDGDVGRRVAAGSDGRWVADFSVPSGPNWEDRAADIVEGSTGFARQTDEDGDSTHVPWRLSAPRDFEASAAWFALRERNEFFFEFELEGSGILDARLQTPVGEWIALRSGWYGEQWWLEIEAVSAAALDARFPPGMYRLEITGFAGAIETHFTLDPGLTIPLADPVFLYPLEGSFQVPTPEALFQWAAVPAPDFSAIFLEVEDRETEDTVFDRFLADTAVTEAWVSGLEADRLYDGHLAFFNSSEQLTPEDVRVTIYRVSAAVVRFSTGEAAPWDQGHASLGGGWRRLDWFGDYIPMGGEGWIWHNRHGFFFVPPDARPDSIWFYTMDMGWVWTRADLYPFWFRHDDGAWLWYNGETHPRWFMNFATGLWEDWP